MTTPAKPHGADCPDRCSICIGARPAQVTVVGGVAHLDGVPQRSSAEPKVSYGRGARRKK